ncbi:MAG: ABC transporter ATP-binding protein [Actinomycetota bacterium]|nr:ABC transporter ATP-binding protein [Actinomycetota bacterium]
MTKRYGEVTAVDALTFSVEPGRVTGFLGPNGSGKSTTMRMMLGVDRPSAGETRFDGQRYKEIQYPGRTVGALIEAKAVDPSRSARNHLRVLAACARISDKRVDEVLELVGLTGAAHRKVGGFSLGMHQRLGVASALLGDPQYLLLDEPTNGLDPEGIRWMREFFRTLAEQGRGLLVSSHMLSELQLYVDHLVVIASGRLLRDVSVDEFVTGTAQAHVRVMSPQMQALMTLLAQRGLQVALDGDALRVTGTSAAIVGDIAAASGVVLHELTTVRESLEEAFLRTTAGKGRHESGGTVDLTDANAERTTP